MLEVTDEYPMMNYTQLRTNWNSLKVESELKVFYFTISYVLIIISKTIKF